MARVQVINETTLDTDRSDWTLWFQWCRYIYDDGNLEYGYRFIWRRPENEGSGLQAARGQARIPSIAILERLVERAKSEGWGNHDGTQETSGVQAAAKRLRQAGMVVDLSFGYVGWPNQAAAAKADLTPQNIADEKLIREYIRIERARRGEDVAERMTK